MRGSSPQPAGRAASEGGAKWAKAREGANASKQGHQDNQPQQHQGSSSAGQRNEGSSRHKASAGGAVTAGMLQSEVDDVGWKVVDAKRGGRSFKQLSKQLERLLDDMYLSCELECQVQQVEGMVEYLELSLQDFQELAGRVRSINQAHEEQALAWQVRPFRRTASNRSSPRPGLPPRGPALNTRPSGCGPAVSAQEVPPAGHVGHTSYALQDAGNQLTHHLQQQQQQQLQQHQAPLPPLPPAAQPQASGLQPDSSQQAGDLQHAASGRSGSSRANSVTLDGGTGESGAGSTGAGEMPWKEKINWTSVFSRKSAARSVLPPAHALPGAISGGGADAALRRASLENPDRRTSVELFGRALLTVAAPPQGSTAPAAPQPGPAGGVLLSSTNDGPAEGSNAKGLSGDVCSSTGLPLPGIPALLDGPPSQADTPTRVFTSTRMGPPAALLLPPSHPTSPTAACAPTFSPSPSPSALGRAQAASCPPTATQHHLSHFGPAQGPGVPVGTVSSNGVHGGACSSSGAPLGTASAAGSTCGVTPLSMSGTASPSSHMASPRRRTPMETKKASEEKQARAERARLALVEERMARLARAEETRQRAQSVKEERVGAILTRFEEKIARSEQLRQAHLAAVAQKAGEEGKKVAEVAFINQMQDEDRKLSLQQKLEEGEARRRELQDERLLRQKEAAAAAEGAAERRRAAEEARMAELAEKARRKEQAQAAFQSKLEEDRQRLAAAREAAREQQARLARELAAAKEQEAAARGSRLEERLKEAATRRDKHLETIRERAALFAQTGPVGAGPSPATNAAQDRPSLYHSTSTTQHLLDPGHAASAGTPAGAHSNSGGGGSAGGHARPVPLSVVLPPAAVQVPPGGSAGLVSPRSPLSSSASFPSSKGMGSKRMSDLLASTAIDLGAGVLTSPSGAPNSGNSGGLAAPDRKSCAQVEDLLQQQQKAHSSREAGLEPVLMSASDPSSQASQQHATSVNAATASTTASTSTAGISTSTAVPQAVPHQSVPQAVQPVPPPATPPQPGQMPVLRSGDRSVTGSTTVKKRLQGLRARAAKLAGRMDAARCEPQLPPSFHTALDTGEGVSLLARWRTLVAACGVHPGMQAARGVNATAAAPAATPPTSTAAAPSEQPAGLAAAAAELRDGTGTPAANLDSSSPPEDSVMQQQEKAPAGQEQTSRSRRRRRGRQNNTQAPEPAASDASLQQQQQKPTVQQSAQGAAENSQPGMASETRSSPDAPLPKAARSAAIHVALSAASADLSRPGLRAAALAAAWPSGLLSMLCAELATAGTGVYGKVFPWDPALPALELMAVLLQEPANVAAVLMANLAPGLVRSAMRALDVCISTETGPQGLTESDTLQHTYLTGLLKVLAMLVRKQPEGSFGWADSVPTSSTGTSKLCPTGSSTGIASTPAASSLSSDANGNANNGTCTTDSADGAGPGTSAKEATAHIDSAKGAAPGSSARRGAASSPSYAAQVDLMRERLIGYHVACGIIHRLSEVFILHDQPAAATCTVTAVSGPTLGHGAVQATPLQRSTSYSANGTAGGTSTTSHTHGSTSRADGHDATLPKAPVLTTKSRLNSSSINGSTPASGPTYHAVLLGASKQHQDLGTDPLAPNSTSVPPIPAHVLQGLQLLLGMTSRGSCAGHSSPASQGQVKCSEQQQGFTLELAHTKGSGVPQGGPVLTPAKLWRPADPNAGSISLAVQETAMAGLPMLLTAVLLHAAPSCTPAEAVPERLPPNFVESALLVMRVLNNIARLDLPALQSCLAASNQRVGFCHLISFLISFATNAWPSSVNQATIDAAYALVASDATWTSCSNMQTSSKGNSSSNGKHSGAGSQTSTGAPLPRKGKAVSSGTAGPGSRSTTPSSTLFSGNALPAEAPATLPAARSHAAGTPHNDSLTSSITSKALRTAKAGAAAAGAPAILALLNEVLVLIGHFSLMAPFNQSMLTWGKPPDCILHRLMQLPLAYLSVPSLTQVFMPTLAAICYGNDRLAELVKPQIAPAHVLLVLLPHLKRQQESQHESHQQNGNSDAAHALHCQEMLALATPSAPLPDQYRLQQRLPVELRAQVADFLQGHAGGAS